MPHALEELSAALDDIVHRSMRIRLECGRPFGLRSLEALSLEILLQQEQEGNLVVNPTQISSSLGVRSPVLSPVLASLELRGYTQKRKDEKDRRCHLVSLTDRGRKVACDFAADKQKKCREMAEFFGEADAREFTRLLKRLSDYMERTEAQPRKEGESP